MQEIRFDSWSGKIPHAAEQLSMWVTTTEPVLSSLGAAPAESWACGLQNEKLSQWKACAPQLVNNFHPPQLEKKLCNNKDPANQKLNKWTSQSPSI